MLRVRTASILLAAAILLTTLAAQGRFETLPVRGQVSLISARNLNVIVQVGLPGVAGRRHDGCEG